MSNLSEIFKNSGIRNLAALIFLLLSFFLNFLYSLYSKVDLFNTNITGEKNKKEKRTVRFISANIRSFYVINCFLQTFFNTIIPISDFAEKIAESLWYNKDYWIIYSLTFVLNLFITFITQIVSDFIANKVFRKKIIFSRIFLSSAFSVARFPTLFGLKLENKPTTKTKKEVKCFFKNLAGEKSLQKMEYQLLKTSLDFRDLEVGEYLVPWKKVICLTSEMTFPEVQKIYSRHLFSNYPVLDEKKKVVGLFNYKMFAWARIKKKNPLWQEYLIKEITVSPQMSLSQLFRKLQESKCQMAIVKQKGWNVGIITKKIILEVLIGEEIQNEEDKLR